MIWKMKPKPELKEWDTRIVSRFALFPVEISGRRKVWLQRYYVKRILLNFDTCYLGWTWTDNVKHYYATLDEVVIEDYENLINA